MNRLTYYGIVSLLIILFVVQQRGIVFSADDTIPSPPPLLTIDSEPDPIPEPDPPPPPPPPPGDEGLLSGMTPSNYSIPNGWSIDRTQDFEGSLGSGEFIDGSITTERSHAGRKSMGGTYSNDQSTVRWGLSEGYAGSYNEIYISVYEYIESQARFNDEFFLFWFKKTLGDNKFHVVFPDWYWARDDNNKPTFNGTKATLYVVAETRGASQLGCGVEDRLAEKTASVPVGSWVQWEVWYRPSTGAVSDHENGFLRIYLNGNLYVSAENSNLNCSFDMSNASIEIGGVYTKLVWMTDYPDCTECSSAPGVGTDLCTDEKGWWGQSFSNPVCSPIDPPLASFKRFFDDIIIMKR